MPGAETVFVAVVIPPPQLKAAPVVVEDATSDKLLNEQVSTGGDAMLTLGAVIFWVTVVDAVLVQLLAGSVTVTV